MVCAEHIKRYTMPKDLVTHRHHVVGQKPNRCKCWDAMSIRTRMLASRRSEVSYLSRSQGGHLRCPYKYEIGQLLEKPHIESHSRRRPLVCQMFCWFTPPMCRNPRLLQSGAI